MIGKAKVIIRNTLRQRTAALKKITAAKQM